MRINVHYYIYITFSANINLIDILYEYYYQQWSITQSANPYFYVNIIRNLIILSIKDFQQVIVLEDNKCYDGSGFRIIKKIKEGFKFYLFYPDKIFRAYRVGGDISRIFLRYH